MSSNLVLDCRRLGSELAKILIALIDICRRAPQFGFDLFLVTDLTTASIFFMERWNWALPPSGFISSTDGLRSLSI